MVPIYLLTHKKADVPLWSWAALSFKIPPTSGATSTYGMAVCGNADVGMLRVGFPIAPEKFCTVDDFGLLNKHLSVVLENEGYMRHSAKYLKKGKTRLPTSYFPISTNIVLSTR